MPTHYVPRCTSKLAAQPCAAGDERSGDYTREQLKRMDSDFVAAVERAIKRGKERRPEEKRAQAA
jgi:hypothetical protein